MPKSITLVSLMLHALKRVSVPDIFDRDPYESRRTALKGEKLVHVLVAYQMVRQPGMRGLLRAIEEHAPLQAALGGPVARDRGYVSFARLAQMRACGAHFVVRLKRGMHWRVRARRRLRAHPCPGQPPYAHSGGRTHEQPR